MANLITLLRLILVFVITAIVEYTNPKLQLLNVPLVIFVMFLDGVDGFVARARKETTVFGAVFDITADRIIEITLWITLLKAGMVSVWVPIIFVVRGVLVDSLRKRHSDAGKTPFSIMQTQIGAFLVASRMMRSLYGTMKIITFAWLLLMLPVQSLFPDFWLNNNLVFQVLSNILIYVTVVICLARGLPVIIEAMIIDISGIPGRFVKQENDG